KALVAIGEYEKVFYGNGIIHDSIGDYKFRISANSFFQTNTLQAVNLYQTALDYACLSGNEVVYDLYCGAGTISIFVSKFAKEIYGFEVVQSAINDAEVNKKLNHTENVKFFLADLYDSFLNVIESQNIPQPDVIIADPPRNGMHKNTVADIIKLSPQKIVYVSCNPTTQVRDLKLFCEAGYKLIKAKPADMFPQTYHIENVILMEKS
ncbi:MAG: 23S rRNA (uracil(1939)-C(5))-methyltransferase RlmD, partial [Ignavibacteria bacterium]|nr:23S rRNA (uracil(1939)-C(5))-methyltransferase RlmD [Ignavibacteria bacterium]